MMILDLEMLKEVLVKQFESFEDRPVWQLHESALVVRYDALNCSTTIKYAIHV